MPVDAAGKSEQLIPAPVAHLENLTEHLVPYQLCIADVDALLAFLFLVCVVDVDEQLQGRFSVVNLNRENLVAGDLVLDRWSVYPADLLAGGRVSDAQVALDIQ